MNPITVSNDIIDTYFRYLMTRFPLGKSNPEIRKQLKELLYSTIGKQRLIRGPILEIISPYEKGCTLKEFSHRFPAWKSIVNHFESSGGFDVGKKLYVHQEKALIKSLASNIIVASGTGSGKTECFLFPIIKYCLENPGIGVRALLIYPLNALVEDQIGRLGVYLKGTEITFGRYTGHTPKTKREAEKKEEKKLCPNHLISREEMRTNPPHILVTNYAMLEYMLIRPGDSLILDRRDQHSFGFIVLDEAHTYSGASGTEVAYLLKRLRHRVGRKVKNTRYFATSATLGSSDEMIDQMITFSRRLFGAPFFRDSLIKGEKQDLSKFLPTESQNEYSLNDILDWGLPGPHLTPEYVKEKLGIETDQQHLKQDIYNKLIKNKYVQEIIRLLQLEPTVVEELADQFFPGQKNGVQAIVNLAAWADFARDKNNLPLLPARYHMFVSAAKGLFCELSSEGTPNFWKHLALSQQDIQKKEGAPYPFELGVCRICGEPYIMGLFVSDEKDKRRMKYKPIADSLFETIESEDERSFNVILHPSPPSLNYISYKVCRLCGTVSGDCEHQEADKVDLYLLGISQGFYKDELIDELPEEEFQEAEINKKKDNLASSCINCRSGKSLSQYVIPLRFPANGSTAPLASRLFFHCPEMGGKIIEKNNQVFVDKFGVRNKDWTPIIASGRKLLLFSDSRQEAAFFGPYMQVSHNQMTFSRWMIDILLNYGTPISIEEWKDLAKIKMRTLLESRTKSALLLKQLRPDENFMNELIKNDTRRVQRIYHAICHLIDGSASSLSGLEGIGIGAVYFNDPQFANTINLQGFSKDQILALAQLILRYIRLKETFYLYPEENVDLSEHDAYFGFRYSKTLLLNPEDKSKGKSVLRLVSKQKTLNQMQILIRQIISRFQHRDLDKVKLEEINEVIKKISSEFFRNELARDRKVNGYQLNIAKLWIMPAEIEYGEFYEPIPGGLSRFKSCQRCGRLSWIDIDNMCNYPDCFGELTAPRHSLQLSKDNHYRYFFLYGLKTPDLRAVEHTAQLDKTTAAKDYQEEFKRGRINILSCSTTFEMGVDLGDLSTVFMRNVPPGTANYVQRAGRAGRREGVSPFVLTFCRNLPHDQYYYSNCMKLVRGEIKPPAIVLENEKILFRHFNAVILTDFLNEYKDAFSTGSQVYIKDPLIYHLFESTECFNALLPRNLSNKKLSPANFLCQTWLPGKLDFYMVKLKEIFFIGNDAMRESFFINTLNGYINSDFFISDQRYGLRDNIERRYLDTISYYESERDHYDPRLRDRKQKKNFEYFDRLIDNTKKEQLIAHLSSRGFLPSYAFPNNVVPLKILSDEAGEKMLDLNRNLEYAISEYAPGAQIAANSRIYTSKALHKYPKQEFEICYYYHCSECNWFTRSLDKKRINKDIQNHYSTTSIIHKKEPQKKGPYRALCPAWGFAVPRDLIGESIRTKTKLHKSGYSSELFMDIDSFKGEIPKTLKLPRKGSIHIEYASGYDMYRVNPGKIDNQNEYNGFIICKNCGRVFDERPGKHETPYGYKCDSIDTINAHLISTFDTDIVRITFKECAHIPSRANESVFKFKSFWRSALYAFMESISRILEIDRNDIDGLFVPILNQPISTQLVFIDSVSGGAGHVARLVGKGNEDPQILINRIVKEAKLILNCDDCAENTACYSCLFHRSNQKVQHTLNRGLALEWISKL
jgi:superfamily II DNA or RNA helicase